MSAFSKETLLNFYSALNITLKAMLSIFIVMVFFYITILLLSKSK